VNCEQARAFKTKMEEQEQTHEEKNTFEKFYNKNYKKLLIIPAIILILSLAYIGIFYAKTGSLINKDVSLTGGTTITIFSDASIEELELSLSSKFPDLIVRALSDNTGKQTQIIVTVPNEPEEIKPDLEEFFNFQLTETNSNIEFTGSSLSKDFAKQLMMAVILAFFWMAGVVFIIFAKGKKIKFYTIVLNILFGILLGTLFFKYGIISLIPLLALMALLIYIYIKNSVPAFAVMLSAFADIVMTLAIVNLVGMKLSTAGIVAFLMLIGYSVDTDILLTTRILKRKESINKALFSAFKTGTTMTITSIIAVATALIIVFSFSSVLNQIFTILLIGLGLDLFNTWITNASIIKWYAETK